MDIIAEKLKDVCVLKLNGQLDSKTSLELEDEILKIFTSDCFKIILDLENIDYVSSAGLRVLKKAKVLKESSCDVIACSAADYVQELFEISGIDAYIPIVSNKEDALKYFLIST